MTLKNANLEDFVISGDSRLLNQDGTPAPVLHQYEYQPTLNLKAIMSPVPAGAEKRYGE